MLIIHDKTQTVKIKIYDSMENKLEPTVGAWVHLTNNYWSRLEKIEKVGKKKFKLVGSEVEYYNTDGRKASKDRWDLTTAVVISEERANELQAQFALKRKADEAKIFIENSVKSLSSENAIKVAEYIKSLQP